MHTQKHPQPVKDCYGCKLQTLSFGTVPGAYRDLNSRSYYDKDSLPNLPGKEEVMDHRADFRHAPTKEMKIGDLAGQTKRRKTHLPRNR